MTTHDVNKFLKDFVKKYDLKQRAIISCKTSLSNCFNDNPNELKGYSLDEICLKFIKHELIFEQTNGISPFVRTRIGLFDSEEIETYNLHHKSIGYYDLDLDINGKSIDDWLIID